MKKIIGYLFIASTLAAGSCARDNSPERDRQGDKITLGGEVETRGPVAADTPFTLMAVIDGVTDASNPFISPTTATLMTDNSVSITQQYYWPLNGSDIRFFGFMKASDTSTPTFTHAAGQLTLTAGAGADYDVLLSNNLAASTNNAANKLVFRHLMTQLKINVVAASGLDTPVVLKGAIAAGKTTGTYSIFEQSANSATPGSTNYSIALEMAVDHLTLPSEAIYHLVPDGTTTITQITSATINDIASDDIAITVPALADDIILEAGVSYELTITISQRGVATATVSIGSWEDLPLPNSSAGIDGADGYSVVWDDMGADVTAVEIRSGTTTNIFNVVEDTQTSGTYLTEGAYSAVSSFDNLAVYHNDTRVDLGASGTYWSYNSGSKTITVDAVLVDKKSQMEAISASAANLAKSYFQVTDIDLGGAEWTPLGTSAEPFEGMYDGLHFNLSGLTITTAVEDNALFGYSQGAIKNVRVVSGSVEGTGNTAVICANMIAGSIENCYNAASLTCTEDYAGTICATVTGGSVSGCKNIGTVNGTRFLGGIVGQMKDAATSLDNCVNEGSVSGDNYVGGIVGYNYLAVDITNSQNRGRIAATGGTTWVPDPAGINPPTEAGTGGQNVGGIVGLTQGGVSYCTNSGDMSTSGFNGGVIAGIAGSSAGAVTHCTNSGNITNNVDTSVGTGGSIGGIVGNCTATTTIADCTNSGKMTVAAGTVCSSIGGIAGSFSNIATDALTRCKNTGSITAPNGSNIGGIAGQNSGHISSSESSGEISGSGSTAGIVGLNYGTVTKAVNKGTVQGLGATSNDRKQIAGIVGNNFGGTITSCTNDGAVTGFWYVAGIAGQSSGEGLIKECTNEGAVTGANNGADSWYVGGITGSIGYEGIVLGCCNKSTVLGVYGVAGIAGQSSGAEISACANRGNVTLYGYYGGGVVGYATGLSTTTSSYNTGTIKTSGNLYVGGVVGYVNYNTAAYTKITDCYNLGSIENTNIYNANKDAIVANSNGCTVTGCFWYGTSASTNAGAKEFNGTQWPVWSGAGNSISPSYWKSLGGWNGGTPTYPTLYWE